LDFSLLFRSFARSTSHISSEETQLFLTNFDQFAGCQAGEVWRTLLESDVLSKSLLNLMSATLWFCLQCSCKKCLSPCDSTGFNAFYYVLFCLFLSTYVLQSVCVHKQIN